MQTNAVLIRRHGSSEVLEYGPIPLGEPRSGQLKVRQIAIGLNFADIYQRRGAAGPHETHRFPVVLGSQGAGVVEAVGDDVNDFQVGDKVAYIHEGLYTQAALVPADRTVLLPPSLSCELAAAFLVRGLTAEYLLHRLYPLKPGQTALVHAAAGGMGEILCQWAQALGARVIGTVGSQAKVDVAYAHGCDSVINYGSQDFVQEVNNLTQGDGVDVVYDAVGKDLFLPSLDCLRPRGMVISYGTASGDVQAFDLQLLHAKSLSVCRPTLKTFIATTAELRAAAHRFIQAIEQGHLKLQVSRSYPLSDIRRAHTELENRQTTGASILLP